MFTDIGPAGLLLVEPQLFSDQRGFFFESFNQQHFDEAVGREVRFVQDNHSMSGRNVLRGMHYQIGNAAQGKLVRVLAGAILDVAVDIRKESATFGRGTGVMLSAENRRQLWVPEGFAHGFLALTDGAEVAYKATAFYTPEAERTIAWNDPDIAIDWQLEGQPILSDKDRDGASLRDAEVFA